MTKPNRDDIAAYLDMVFGYLDPGDENHAYCIALRGLGEKGTAGEGDFMDPQIVPPLRGTLEVDVIYGHVLRWSANQRASFIVPAAVSPRALSDKHATEDRILQLTTMLVDLDKGDTAAALAHAEKYIGRASMIVHSGGVTDTGAPKLHVYWKLTEPTTDVARWALLRKQLALKIGGDASFGRSTQVIRIPGSVYNKSAVTRPCFIQSREELEYESDEMATAISDMTMLEGIVVEASKLGAVMPSVYAMGGGLNFSAFKAAKGDLVGEKPDIGQSLTTDIHEGGDIDRSRWGEFNRITGLYIKQARDGLIKMDDARGMAHNWMMLHMKPPFPPMRFESEWNGLVKADARNHGPVIEGNVISFKGNPNLKPPEDTVENLDGTLSLPVLLTDWDVGDWADGDRPVRKFLVPGIIQAGKSHLLAAEGGAGKTFLLLDLAAKIASHDPTELQNWCGLPLADDAGGNVVMFTTEDDREEIKIRLSDILTKEQRARIKQRKTLKIIPTINAGGAFALVERQRAQGPARTGERWQAFINQLKTVPNLKLVAIDTLNSTMHAEENSATAINEYVQAAQSVICGELGATLIVTHHIRKAGNNVKIYTPEDMKAAIRGSTAIIGAFRVVLGIWAAPDYKSRLSQMAMQPKRGQLYNLAVLKANNPEMDFNTRALIRQPSGLLIDITDREKTLVAGAQSELGAWIVKAAEYAADKGHPFTIKAMVRRPPNGRRFQLPPILRDLTERELQRICELLVEDGQLVQCNPKGQTKYNYLDVPAGPLARSDAAEDGTLYKLGLGKDFEPPDWHKLYAYHVVEQRIVKRGTEQDRTVRQGAKPPVETRPAAPFNPNTSEQDNSPPPVAPIAPVAPEAVEVLHPTPPAAACTRAPNLIFSPDCRYETKA